MAKTFAVTAILFSAIQEAIAGGQPLDEYAACSVKYDRSLPEGTTIASYIAAVDAYKVTNAAAVAVTTLQSQASKVTSKAAKLVALDKAVQAHNADNADNTCRIVYANGTFTVEGTKGKRKGKATGTGGGGRMSAPLMAAKYCKTDNYSFSSVEVPSTGKNKKYQHSVNGVEVSNVAAALAELVNDGTVPAGSETDKYMREYYPKRIK